MYTNTLIHKCLHISSLRYANGITQSYAKIKLGYHLIQKNASFLNMQSDFKCVNTIFFNNDLCQKITRYIMAQVEANWHKSCVYDLCHFVSSIILAYLIFLWVMPFCFQSNYNITNVQVQQTYRWIIMALFIVTQTTRIHCWVY